MCGAQPTKRISITFRQLKFGEMIDGDAPFGNNRGIPYQSITYANIPSCKRCKILLRCGPFLLAGMLLYALWLWLLIFPSGWGNSNLERVAGLLGFLAIVAYFSTYFICWNNIRLNKLICWRATYSSQTGREARDMDTVEQITSFIERRLTDIRDSSFSLGCTGVMINFSAVLCICFMLYIRLRESEPPLWLVIVSGVGIGIALIAAFIWFWSKNLIPLDTSTHMAREFETLFSGDNLRREIALSALDEIAQQSGEVADKASYVLFHLYELGHASQESAEKARQARIRRHQDRLNRQRGK